MIPFYYLCVCFADAFFFFIIPKEFGKIEYFPFVIWKDFEPFNFVKLRPVNRIITCCTVRLFCAVLPIIFTALFLQLEQPCCQEDFQSEMDSTQQMLMQEMVRMCLRNILPKKAYSFKKKFIISVPYSWMYKKFTYLWISTTL